MARLAHLLVDISSHGFGHIAQTAPILNALRLRQPALRLTIRSGASRAMLASRITGDFEHIPSATDFGMVMVNALEVDVEASARAYEAFHCRWPDRVAEEADRLARLAPDLVLSNISYLTLAAASRAGIPSLALGSLNWADIYGHYCAGLPAAAEIRERMLEAYNGARLCVRLEPGMPMEALRHVRPAGPVAQVGADRRQEVRRLLNLGHGDTLVLVSLGGMAFRLPMESWPELPGLTWLVPASWGIHRDRVFPMEAVGMHFTDLLRSCDVLLSKPGYGSFAEAAANGIPVLFVERRDWPESGYLVDWLTVHGRGLELTRGQADRGELSAQLEQLRALPAKPPVPACGAAEAAELVLEHLTAVTRPGG